MSQQEVHIGKIRKIERKVEIYCNKVKIQTVEEWCREYCINKGMKFDKYYDSWTEYFMDEFSGEFIIVDNEIYEVIKNKRFEGADIFNAHENEDGDIEYCLSYYNGGCGFTEAIEEAIKNMKNK